MTGAGRRLFERLIGTVPTGGVLLDLILAIEAEARNAALDEIGAKVRELAAEAPASYVKAILAAIEEVRR